MKIKRLIDRSTNKQITPMTHYDSVFDSNGKKIREKFVPVAHTGTSYAEYINPETNVKERAHAIVTLDNEGGFMSSDMLKQQNFAISNGVISVDVNSATGQTGDKVIRLIDGNKVKITEADLSESELSVLDPVTNEKLPGKKITIAHETIETTEATADKGMQEPSSSLTYISALTRTDGHITKIDKQTFTFPQKVYTSTDGSSDLLLVGSPAASGNNIHETDANLTYTRDTDTLNVEHINIKQGISGGAKGSIIYQTAPNTSVMLGIGTTGQVLRVKDGAPAWSENTGIKSVETWATSNTAGPKTNIILDDTNSTKIAVPSIPAASPAEWGVVSTGEQVFSGKKTFNDDVVIVSDLTVQGNLISTHETDVVVSDKMITLATSESATSATGTGSGIEVTTKYNASATSLEDKYQGPTFRWETGTGWTTGTTDTAITSSDLSMNIPSGAVYKIGGTQVLSNTQYIGNSKTADKVNHTLTLNTGKVFDGSENVVVGLNDISGTLNVNKGGTGATTFVANEIIVGNGTGALSQIPYVKTADGKGYETSYALFQGATGKPEFRNISIDDVKALEGSELVLMNITDYGEVADFTV